MAEAAAPYDHIGGTYDENARTATLKRAERHSAKLDIFYERVREVSPGPRLELFARTPREGFQVWGHEVRIGSDTHREEPDHCETT
jgi:N6-adenosine-specific RNA methylase IME4